MWIRWRKSRRTDGGTWVVLVWGASGSAEVIRLVVSPAWLLTSRTCSGLGPVDCSGASAEQRGVNVSMLSNVTTTAGPLRTVKRLIVEPVREHPPPLWSGRHAVKR